MTKTEQIEQLKLEQRNNIYEVHKTVIDSLLNGLSEDTDKLFEATDEYLASLQHLINEYSVVGGTLKDDYLNYQTQILTDLHQASVMMRDRQNLRVMELQRYVMKLQKELNEAMEE